MFIIFRVVNLFNAIWGGKMVDVDASPAGCAFAIGLVVGCISVVVVPALLANYYGPSDNLEYNIKKTVKEERIEFMEYNGAKKNVLQITKQNGDIAKYTDYDNDLKVDKVTYVYDKQKKTLTLANESKELSNKVQAQFEGYLTKILDYKQQEKENITDKF